MHMAFSYSTYGMATIQGLTLLHFSNKRKHFWRGTQGGFTLYQWQTRRRLSGEAVEWNPLILVHFLAGLEHSLWHVLRCSSIKHSSD
jgi:hypothetical protein